MIPKRRVGGAHRDDHRTRFNPLRYRHYGLVARLAPTGHQHVNFLGRYEFSTPTVPTDGTLRPRRT